MMGSCTCQLDGCQSEAAAHLVVKERSIPPLRSGNSENGKDISFTFKGATMRAHRREGENLRELEEMRSSRHWTIHSAKSQVSGLPKTFLK